MALKKTTQKFNNVNEYILSFNERTKKILAQIRAAVLQAAPKATEGVSYNMPALKFNGKPLIYYAAYKSHIGFYATPTGHAAFVKELSNYKQGEGSVQFPINEPMPIALIKKIVKFRLNECAIKPLKKEHLKIDNNVDDFIANLKHPLEKEITALRNIILLAHKKLTENIKWNAPNYHIDGEDRITMRLQPNNRLELILHRGAKVKELPKQPLIIDKLNLLTWKTTDRAMIAFTNNTEIETLTKPLTTIINDWIKAAT